MPDSRSGETPMIGGKREYDPKIVVRPRTWITWLTLGGVIVGAVSGIINYVGSQVARPAQVAELKNNQASQAILLDSLHRRLDTTDVHVQDIKDLIEIIAIDVCLRRADDAFAQSRLRCSTRLRR